MMTKSLTILKRNLLKIYQTANEMSKKDIWGHFERILKSWSQGHPKLGTLGAYPLWDETLERAAPAYPKNKDKLGRKGIITPTADQFQVLKGPEVG